jgi:hypothetical protein
VQLSRGIKSRKSATKSKSQPKEVREGGKAPVLLSGGNPRIAKADGSGEIRDDELMTSAVAQG